MPAFSQRCNHEQMCNTLTYCDLGKAAKDVFNKGYRFSMVKIDLRTKSCSGVEFSTSGHAYTDTGNVSGNLETKYKVCNYGLTFTQKWNTDNTLGTKISLEKKLAEGLKLTLDTIFVPNTGKKMLAVMLIQIFLDQSSMAGLLAFEGWLAGHQMSFDTAKYKLSQNNFALGYKAADFSCTLIRLMKIETSINLAWTAGSINTCFGIAAKYKLDCRTSLSTLQPGVTLTLSALIDGKNFSAGGHKVGLGFELEA
ncbi:unnamed protein product [Nyctereutes procyonoides]|uniref:Non-selective voltage-gated ion channel VDAC3 n=1 Tax=Nyctereutes procyonoides TaxID=34880 RepID=A0A811ZSE2_NYCPR|nr:unnamed protein product [Nyctereutes procyonoides]